MGHSQSSREINNVDENSAIDINDRDKILIGHLNNDENIQRDYDIEILDEVDYLMSTHLESKPIREDILSGIKKSIYLNIYKMPIMLSRIVDEYEFLENIFRLELCRLLKIYLDTNGQEIEPDFFRLNNNLKSLFNLDENAIKVINYIYVFNTNGILSNIFKDLMMHTYANRHRLAIALNMSKSMLLQKIDELINIGLVKIIGSGVLKFTCNVILTLLKFPEDKNVDDLFCNIYKSDIHSIYEYSVENSEVNYLLSLLKEHTDKGINILLYGPSGSGKSSFAKSIAHVLGVNAWALAHTNSVNPGKDRRMAINICLNRARTHKGDIVVVDDAENIFFNVADHLSQHKHMNISWITELMDKNDNTIIWILRDPNGIDEKIKRRFDASFYFKPLGINERLCMWKNILGSNGIDK
jgi:hypothetical protein